MIRSCSGLVLAALMQVILSRGEDPVPPIPHYQDVVPRHCLGPPPGIDLHKCCPIPRLYPDEVMESCGIDRERADDTTLPPKSERPFKPPCKEGTCLMQNADLLMANQSVDYEKLRAFIGNWAETNPEFTEAILEAKKICAKEGVARGVCEPDEIFFCLTSNILWNCKLRDLNGSSGCSILKAHMDECRPYYLKMKEIEEQRIQKLM